MTYTYLNEDEIDIELKCSICAEPFQLPMNCKFCGNTYCQRCIFQWLEEQSSCPSCREMGNHFTPVISRVVINQLNRLLVQCKLCDERNIQRSNFLDHISCTCPKQMVQCTDHCGWNGYRENLSEHLIQCRAKALGRKENLQWWKMIMMAVVAMIFFFIVKKTEKKKMYR